MTLRKLHAMSALVIAAFAAVVALFTHLGCAAYWQSEGRPRLARTLMIAVPCAVGSVMSLVIVLSLAGALFPVDIPTIYKATYVLSKP